MSGISDFLEKTDILKLKTLGGEEGIFLKDKEAIFMRMIDYG